jgi:hypothetical protein
MVLPFDCMDIQGNEDKIRYFYIKGGTFGHLITMVLVGNSDNID